MEPVYTEITQCRACKSSDLSFVFSLGNHRINGFPTSTENLPPKCPIELVLCNGCTLVQLKHSVRPDLLYTGHYWYRCIGAQEKIFARVKGWGRYKDKDCLVHETADNVFSSPYDVYVPCIQLDGTVEWRRIVARQVSEQPVYDIEFFTGAVVTASADHKWPRLTSDMRWISEKTTDKLKPKDRVGVVLKMDRPDDVIDHDSIYDGELGYLIGVYLAEGSETRDGFRMSVHRDKDADMISRICKTVNGRLFDSAKLYPATNPVAADIDIRGPVVCGVIQKFVSGRLSKGKKLTSCAWSQPTQFLQAIVDGWLDGDGHYEPDAKRWRFNICKNTDLVEDIALACRLVGYTMRYRLRKGTGFRGSGDKVSQYSGWVRKSVGENVRQKNMLGNLGATSVKRVWKKPTYKRTWDIHVGGSELYSLGCGIVTHNSGATQTMRDALAEVAVKAYGLVDLKPDDIVLDIGSNDGTLLRMYPNTVSRIGFEPAKNFYDVKIENGLIVNDFWSAYAFTKFVGGKAKIVTALGMLYDLEDPNQFIADVAKVLAPDGIFIAQLMTLWNMIQLGDVGNLCHEHLEFYSLRSLRLLLNKNGLEVFDIETNSVNGQSDRLYITQRNSKPISQSVITRLDTERNSYLHQSSSLQKWFAEWDKNRDRCVNCIQNLVDGGMKVWVYGASTKGNTILQYYNLGPDTIEAAVDVNPDKWGKYTVNGIPIKNPDEFRKADPDYALVLPYAFLDEFRKCESEWWNLGGRFIVPLPELKVV